MNGVLLFFSSSSQPLNKVLAKHCSAMLKKKLHRFYQ